MQWCFLDVTCINQINEEMMERGIYGISGFIAATDELFILWCLQNCQSEG